MYIMDVKNVPGKIFKKTLKNVKNVVRIKKFTNVE